MVRKVLHRACSLFLVCILTVSGVASALAVTGKVNASALRLRKEPGMSAAVLTTLSRGTEVSVLSEEQVINGEGAWYAVSYGSLTGYMSADYLTITQTSAPEEANTGTEDEGQKGVTTARVNFRSDASLQASVLQVLAKGTIVDVLESSGSWYTVSHKGTIGYISADYVSFDTDAATPVVSTYNYTGSTTTERDRQIAAEVMAVSVSTDSQQKLLEIAVSLLGAPYVYGASGSTSFDCSGFTSYVYKQLGVGIQRTALNQYRLDGSAVDSAAALQSGDLVFFRDTSISKNAVSHVGIYLGGGLFIHAGSGNTGAGRCVKVSDLSTGYYARVFVCGKRLL